MTHLFRPTLLAVLALLGALVLDASAQSSRGTATRAGTSSGRSNQRSGTGTSTGRPGGIGGAGSSMSGPRQYRSNTLLGDAIIQIDPESRSLVIITDEETHLEVEKIIRSLDQPRPQVLIKVVFVEVTWDKSLDLGLEGSYTFNVGNPTPAVNAGTTTSTTVSNGGLLTDNKTPSSTNTTVSNQTIAAAAKIPETITASNLFGLSNMTQGSFVRVMTDNWSATLHALAQHGKVEILSRPSIMARNNQEAVIVVGQEVPFVTNSRITDNGQTINTVTYDNVGIILKVTPFITSDSQVEMIVAPEISSLTDQTVAISNNATAPVIAKRSAETVVVTPNRMTVVIGGLMETQRTKTIQKIPLLGDIPALGALFRHKVTSDTKRELMIFLTPEIVNNAEGLRAATVGEAQRTELVRDSFKNGELNRYLDNPLFDSDTTVVQSDGKQLDTEVHEHPKAMIIHKHSTVIKADEEEDTPRRKPLELHDPKPPPMVPGPSTPSSAAEKPTIENNRPPVVPRAKSIDTFPEPISLPIATPIPIKSKE